MWQRFTTSARKVIFYAQEEAGRLGENYVSTEHLILGLIRENESVAVQILGRFGVSPERIRKEIERQVSHGGGRLSQDMQLTPRAKRVIDLAYEEALRLQNNYIGTEHLLLGMILEGEGLAGRTLTMLGVDADRVRSELKDLQSNLEAGQAESNRDPVPVPGGLGEQMTHIREILRKRLDGSIERDIAIGKFAEAEVAIASGEPTTTLSELGAAREWVHAVAKTMGAALVVAEIEKASGG